MQQADGASLSPTDATKPTAWRRGSAHPDHLIRCYDRVLLRATIGSGRDVAYADTRKRANELEQPRIGSSRMQEGEPEGARFGSGQVRLGVMAPRLDESTCASDVPLLILGSMPVAHGTQTRKSGVPPAGPRFPVPGRDRDSRSRPNREAGFPPRFPAKSGIGGTGIGDFRVWSSSSIGRSLAV